MSIIPSLFSDSRLQKEVLTYSRVRHLKLDEVLILPGNKITFVPIVLEGVLRIVRVDEDGR
jgi:CRP/FNR family transcriptional regulator